jgi:hypothetical protein
MGPQSVVCWLESTVVFQGTEEAAGAPHRGVVIENSGLRLRHSIVSSIQV